MPGMFIANVEENAIPVPPITLPQPGTQAPPAPQHNGTAYWIKVSAQQDGAFCIVDGIDYPRIIDPQNMKMHNIRTGLKKGIRSIKEIM